MSSTRAANRVIAAESSLARAAWLAPGNVVYAGDLAEHLFGVSPTNITRAENVLESVLEKARGSATPQQLSAMADRLGVMKWRRYEGVGDRRATKLDPRFDLFFNNVSEFPKWLELYTYDYHPPLGVGLREDALKYFRTAVSADPLNEHAARHEMMVYLDQGDWNALAEVVRERLRVNPQLPWWWLGQGVAYHERGQSELATQSFETGLALLPERQRNALTDIGRVLSVNDAARHATLPDSVKRRMDALFWNVGSPSLLIPGNAFRSEFLSRVVFAEIRWSNEEQGVSGLQSDRGDAYIRFGPPDLRASFALDTGPNVAWLWKRQRLHLFFRQEPLYGTALMNQSYRSNMYEPVIAENPSFFGSVPGVVRGRDTVVVQASRFRAANDSTELVVFAGVRRKSTDQGEPSAEPNDRIGAFALGKTGEPVSQKIAQLASPIGDQTIRLTTGRESVALRVDGMRGQDASVSRWIADLPPRSNSGLAISDVMISENASLATPQAPTTRWFDFTITPHADLTFSRARPLDLLWEMYELSPSAEGTRYQLTITLQRVNGRSAGAVVARVIGRAASSVGVSSSSRSDISLTYDRAVPASAVIAEAVRLDIKGAPTGEYRIAISVTDRSSGRTVRTERTLSIVE
ncbi:GWxTD domain-containing protein [Gemmatimonas sp.]|uniref:GWxTD domain-containing protein n=1 Tax=Gemmatimonas sp. TaxID=1962908 RepID=UPI00286CE86D|nr:GWxTD domain-containing protein [Gemmatimonas sp.]